MKVLKTGRGYSRWCKRYKTFDICGLGIAYRAQDNVRALADAMISEKNLMHVITVIEDHYGISFDSNKQ